MVTADVPDADRQQMERVGWKIHEVEPLPCHVKNNFDAKKYDLQSPNVQAGLQRWKYTCTKFRAWNLVDYDRILFMDSDTLVVAPLDDIVFGAYSNSSFQAAPDTFPPDNFNAGVMVVKPSAAAYAHLLLLNEKVGSVEGGDQGVLNNGLCPSWATVGPQDPHCGRLPWLVNVGAVHYTAYRSLQEGSGKRLPCVVHFDGDGKPWTVLLFEYLSAAEQAQIPMETKGKLAAMALPHILWRRAYFRAIGQAEPAAHFLTSGAAAAGAAAAMGGSGASTPRRKKKVKEDVFASWGTGAGRDREAATARDRDEDPDKGKAEPEAAAPPPKKRVRQIKPVPSAHGGGTGAGAGIGAGAGEGAGEGAGAGVARPRGKKKRPAQRKKGSAARPQGEGEGAPDL